MKKTILFGSTLPILFTPVISVVSCGSSSSDYYTMAWYLDQEKVDELSSDYQTFNEETVTLEKIKKITKTTNFSRYTSEAIDKGWFESISYEVDKQNKPIKLVVKLKSQQTINNKTKKCPYRLSNGSLTLSISVTKK